MVCNYCNREIVGEGVDIASSDGCKTLYFCDRVCGISYFDADLMHPDCFDRETRIACLKRRKERDPETFEVLMKAINWEKEKEKNNDLA